MLSHETLKMCSFHDIKYLYQKHVLEVEDVKAQINIIEKNNFKYKRE